MGPTELLVQYVSDARFEDLPKDVVEKAKLIILDSIGCALSGSRTELGKLVIDQINEIGGKRESVIFGKKMRTHSVWAGYVNAILIDALDYEETAIAHPSASIIPAAFALGEVVRASGKNLVLAVVLGFEVSLRIGYAILPTPEVARVVASVYSFLSFGACVAAGKILGINSEEWMNAFGYAGAATPLPTWISKWERPLHWVKNNYSEQTQAGILGVLLAKRGFLGPRKVLDGDLGFWRMVGSDRCNTSRMTEGLGTVYEIRKDTFKPYPACRWLHTALDALDYILMEQSLNLKEIESITVKTSKDLIDWLVDYKPQTMIDGEFSLPYCMAMILMRQKPGPLWYSDVNLSSKEAVSCMVKIKTESDPEANEIYLREHRRIATVCVRMKNGKEFNKKVVHPKGDLENPMTEAELVKKFEGLASSVIRTKSIISNITELILNLEKLKNINKITSLLYKSC